MRGYPTKDFLLRALDSAIEAYRDNPTEENLAELRLRQEQHTEGFFRTNAEEYIRRTKRGAP